MIYPFQDFTVKGILWYQGEGNRNDPEPYKGYMKDLILTWRKQWNNNKLPFYSVQIAPYAYEKHRNTPEIKANLIREAQMEIPQEISYTGTVVTSDAGDCDEIHPSKKEIVALRLANWALANQYRFKEVHYKSPEFKSMTINDNQVTIAFNFYHGDTFDISMEIDGFVIAGKDQVFYPASANWVDGGRAIILESKQVKNPVSVRYGFEDCFEGSLKSNSGLPVSLFRTDNWGITN